MLAHSVLERFPRYGSNFPQCLLEVNESFFDTLGSNVDCTWSRYQCGGSKWIHSPHNIFGKEFWRNSRIVSRILITDQCVTVVVVHHRLIHRGANIMARKTSTGCTPLHVACLYNCTVAIPLLLAREADLNALNKVFSFKLNQ